MTLAKPETGLLKYYSRRKFTGSFKVDPELWSGFKGVCKQRGVSICYVLEGLIEAWIAGQKATATILQPVVVNLTQQHIVERPRRTVSFRDMVYFCKSKLWPPNCKEADTYMKSMKEVGCLRSKEFVSLDACWRCFIDEHR